MTYIDTALQWAAYGVVYAALTYGLLEFFIRLLIRIMKVLDMYDLFVRVSIHYFKHVRNAEKPTQHQT